MHCWTFNAYRSRFSRLSLIITLISFHSPFIHPGRRLFIQTCCLIQCWPSALRPWAFPARPWVWPVIYEDDHLVDPGCHGQQDGNLLINAPHPHPPGALALQPCLIDTRKIKQRGCPSRPGISFPPTIAFDWAGGSSSYCSDCRDPAQYQEQKQHPHSSFIHLLKSVSHGCRRAIPPFNKRNGSMRVISF